jgi:hypothetical protein
MDRTRNHHGGDAKTILRQLLASFNRGWAEITRGIDILSIAIKNLRQIFACEN